MVVTYHCLPPTGFMTTTSQVQLMSLLDTGGRAGLKEWLMQQPDRSNAWKKVATYGLADWIRIKHGVGKGTKRKLDYLRKQKHSHSAIFYKLSALLFHAWLKTGDTFVFIQVQYFGTLCENCRLISSIHRELQTSVQSLAFHCTSKVGERVHAADRSCHLLLCVSLL